MEITKPRKTYQQIRGSEKTLLFGYFLFLIVLGMVLLYLPASWAGPGRLRLIDALFTSTSAVCVTGLITVDTAAYSSMGRIIIILLIQAGGLGIITFATLYLARPLGKISLIRRGVIKGYFLESVESEPLRIIERIIFLTLAIEILGALLLWPAFRRSLDQGALFFSLFHAISAFCNAGFSLFSNSLEGYGTNPRVVLTVGGLIVLGGLGFVVLQDVGARILGRRSRLNLHTRIVLVMTLALVGTAAALFLLFEARGTLKGLSPLQKILAASFQALTPRTAGFNTLNQAQLASPSKLLTIMLMFIGGASGSIAGGIKITTFFVILTSALQSQDSRGGVVVFSRKIPPRILSRANQFFIKALFILFTSLLLLTVTELWLPGKGSGDYFMKLLFECFSAFGTVGLSLGITTALTGPGKLVIIGTMFMGRVGLLALAIPPSRQYPAHLLDYPEGEVMIG